MVNPGKGSSKVLFLRVKTHKLTVAVTLPRTATVGALKIEVLSALTSDALPSNGDEAAGDIEMLDASAEIPSISEASDFELCTAEKERGRLTGEFPVLRDVKQTLADVGLVNWDAVFVRFKNDAGELEPVVFVPFEDDEDQITPQFAEPAPPEPTKGKRKARPD